MTADVNLTDTITLGNVVTILVIILLAGLVAGQFRRGVVTELRAALETATSEIDIQRGRGDRLEAEVKRLGQENSRLQGELGTLREVLVGGGHLTAPIGDMIQEIATRSAGHLMDAQRSQTEELLVALDGLREEIIRRAS